MLKYRRPVLLFLLFSLIVGSMPINAQSAPDDPKVRALLQEHLDRVEARREIDKLKIEQLNLEKRALSLQSQLKLQKANVEKQKLQVGRLLRAYYANERPSLLAALLAAESWSDFFLILDFLQIIYDRDREILNAYKLDVQLTTNMKNDLDSFRVTIKQSIAHYESQIKRLDQLNRQLDGKLSKLPDADKVRLLMTQLEEDWLKKGLPAFELYFEIISDSMRYLPEMVDLTQVEQSGSKLIVTFTDNQLNQFLAKKNQIFENTRFTFKDNEMWIEGIHEGAALTVMGGYELISPKEMQFQVNQLIYDGYQLPKSTQDQLATKFDLGFYPTLIHPNIRIDSLVMSNGSLKLVVKFSLGD